MPDNPLVVALLREYMDEGLLTRTEAGRIIGKTRGQVAGICDRNGIKPWPKIPPEVKNSRSCVFPVGIPDTPEFRLCDNPREGDPLCCQEHRGKKWVPSCKVISLPKT